MMQFSTKLLVIWVFVTKALLVILSSADDKRPLISPDLHFSVIKCHCQTYVDNIGLKLKKASFAILGVYNLFLNFFKHIFKHINGPL